MDSRQDSNFSSDDQPVVTIRGARKFYGRRLVLDIPDFTLNAGDTVALLGHNGSGKSTLLRLLSGATQQSSGVLQRSEAWHRARIGFVPQSGGINLDLTVAENLHMYRRLYDRDGVDGLAESTLFEEFGLTELLNERAGNLSGGYQHLLAIISTLDIAPDGLLLDEPFSGLDRQHSDRLHNTLNERARDLLFLVVTGHTDHFLTDMKKRLTLVKGRPQ